MKTIAITTNLALAIAIIFCIELVLAKDANAYNWQQQQQYGQRQQQYQQQQRYQQQNLYEQQRQANELESIRRQQQQEYSQQQWENQNRYYPNYNTGR